VRRLTKAKVKFSLSLRLDYLNFLTLDRLVKGLELNCGIIELLLVNIAYGGDLSLEQLHPFLNLLRRPFDVHVMVEDAEVLARNVE
jgi:hypothetical protein